MMDLSIGKLLSCGRKYAEYFPLNRGTQDEAELEMQLIGLAKEEDGSVKLLLLEPFEKNESDAFPTRTRNVTTKRQQLTQIARRLKKSVTRITREIILSNKYKLQIIYIILQKVELECWKQKMFSSCVSASNKAGNRKPWPTGYLIYWDCVR